MRFNKYRWEFKEVIEMEQTVIKSKEIYNKAGDMKKAIETFKIVKENTESRHQGNILELEQILINNFLKEDKSVEV